jgi:hypothetical protein
MGMGMGNCFADGSCPILVEIDMQERAVSYLDRTVARNAGNAFSVPTGFMRLN